MIKAQIEKGKQAVIEAQGSLPELVNDIAILIGSIYGQFQAARPDTAQLFRMAVTGVVVDPESRAWKPIDGQTGIIFPKPEQGSDATAVSDRYREQSEWPRSASDEGEDHGDCRAPQQED